MRKKVAMVLAVILILSAIPFAQSARAAGEGIVRVKLSVEEAALLAFFVDGNYTVGEGTTALERDQYTVRLESGSLNMYCGATLIASGTSIKLNQRAETSGRNNFIWMNNALYGKSCAYLGDMEFLIDGSVIEVVNHIFIEDYLYGVVPYEMSDSWPLEALKSQAVAARNYAAKRIGGGGSYDITDNSSNDQVYKGYSPTAANAIAAVNATAGQVLTFGGSMIDCYFGASNGGWTDIPYHRWGSSESATWPYYVITNDPYDTANTNSPFETIFLPVSNLETSLGVYTATTSDNYTGTQPNAALAIAYFKQCIVNSGQLAAYGVTDINGFLLTGITSFNTAPPYDTDGSQDHSLTQDLNGDSVPDPNYCVDMTGAAGTFTVTVGGAPYTVTISNIDLRYLDGTTEDQSIAYLSFFQPLGVFFIEPVYADTILTGFNVSQRRYGHGLGLSQRGAQQRAGYGDETVKYYNQILAFYYPGTDITTQTYTRPTLTAVATPDHTNAAVKLSDSTPLKVRSAPVISTANILGNLPDKARIEVVQANAATGSGYTWHKILFAGQYAYVAVNYVLLDDPQPAPQICTVKFEPNGGGAVPDWTGNHGGNIASAPSVSKTNYGFGGWYTDSALTKPASFPYIVTSDASLYAKWIDAYTITYNYNGGSASNPASYSPGGAITLSNPTLSGYNFAGWTGTGLTGPTMSVTIPAGTTGNLEYTANWTIATYSITYNYNGGAASNPGSYTIYDAFTLNNPVMSGYNFAGWTGTGLSGPTMTVTVPAGSAGNRGYTANWSAQAQTPYLSGIGISLGTLNRAFTKTYYKYKITLGEYQESVTLTPVREFDGATLTIAGKAVSSYTVSLANGKSMTVSVKVKFGRTSKTYKFTISRAKSTNNNLASLTSTAGWFDRPFDPNVTSYVLTLDENTKSARILDTVAVPLAKASFKSKSVSLSNGQSKKVTLTVKAQSGARKTYTITVVRAPSTNTALKYLKTNSRSTPLTPAYSAGVTSYTVTLPANKSSVTLSAKALGYKAAVYFDGAKRSSKKVTLANGQSAVVRVTVVAQSGAVREFTITVIRP